MSIHRCALPERVSGARTFRCLDCGADYVWSKRMIDRKVHEGWSRTFGPIGGHRARITGTDEEFDRWFNRAAVFAVLAWLICTAGFVALVVWIVLRVTS